MVYRMGIKCVLCEGETYFKQVIQAGSGPLIHLFSEYREKWPGGGGGGSTGGKQSVFETELWPSYSIETAFRACTGTNLLRIQMNVNLASANCVSVLINLDLYLVTCITASIKNMSALQIARQQLTLLFTLFTQLLYVAEITIAHFYIWPRVAWAQRISTVFIYIFSGYVCNCNLKFEILIIFIVVFCHTITVICKEQTLYVRVRNEKEILAQSVRRTQCSLSQWCYRGRW
jgi:hypothetical protein